MPTLLSNPSTPVLQEATPFPTDVVGGLVGGSGSVNPGITKGRFNVNVRIESNDMLIETRSDSLANRTNINLWLQGSNNLAGVYRPLAALRRAVQLPDPARDVRAAGPAEEDRAAEQLRRPTATPTSSPTAAARPSSTTCSRGPGRRSHRPRTAPASSARPTRP
jgi:hypothetical protein